MGPWLCDISQVYVAGKGQRFHSHMLENVRKSSRERVMDFRLLYSTLPREGGGGKLTEKPERIKQSSHLDKFGRIGRLGRVSDS